MRALQTVVTMVNVTELYPGVTYNFTILAFNEVGNSSSSDVTPFRTLDEGEPQPHSYTPHIETLGLLTHCNYKDFHSVFSIVPSSSPQNVKISVNSSTEILVTWEEIPEMDQNEIIITYEVLYEPLQTFDGQLEPQTVNTIELFTYLTTLQEFVSYNISVRAYTSAGPGPYSDEIFAMTLEDSNLI